MKKTFKFMAIAAVAFGLCMNVGCGKEEEGGENGGNGGNNTPVENPENLPTTLDEQFTGGIPDTWTTIDADGDGYTWCNWINNQSGVQMDPMDCAVSFSYLNGVGVLTPDNYLVSPKIYIEDGATLTFTTEGIDASYYAEHYAVLLGNMENGQFVSIATLMEKDVPTVDVHAESIDLSEYKGKSVCIAFRHYNCTDVYTMKLDDVKVAK